MAPTEHFKWHSLVASTKWTRIIEAMNWTGFGRDICMAYWGVVNGMLVSEACHGLSLHFQMDMPINHLLNPKWKEDLNGQILNWSSHLEMCRYQPGTFILLSMKLLGLLYLSCQLYTFNMPWHQLPPKCIAVSFVQSLFFKSSHETYYVNHLTYYLWTDIVEVETKYIIVLTTVEWNIESVMNFNQK